MAKRHTLGSLFAAIFRPFLDAWRDEFGARHSNETITARAVLKGAEPAPPVLAVAPGQTWREAMAERLAAEPPGVRPNRPAVNKAPEPPPAPRKPAQRKPSRPKGNAEPKDKPAPKRTKGTGKAKGKKSSN